MRRALLIGAETFGLKGVEPDVEEVAGALGRRGFTVSRCTGRDADRQGIIAAYRRLIAETGADDVALVYYAGHGGYVEAGPGEKIRPGDNTRQFIVPTDFEKSGSDDFRGITAVELSVLLAELTEKTRNATVILDCCHSAVMSRDLGDARVRQIDAVQADLDEHHRQAIADGLRVDLPRPNGNENAVRLVACGQGESAHEIPRGDGSGRHNGVLTLAFVQALDEATSRHVTWSRLLGRVRHLVRLQMPHQRPTVEGPFERLLFEIGTEDAAGWLPVTDDGDGRARLPGAMLLGVHAGDEFAIMPASGTGDRIATLRIDRVDPQAAGGRLDFGGSPAPLPVDARAYRITAVAERLPVRVPAALVEAVGRASFVQVAGPEEEAPVEVVESADGALTIRDRIGPLHQNPRLPGPGTAAQVLVDLNRIGRATVLRGIREEPGGTVDTPVDVEWGLVRQGRTQTLPARGQTVHPGDLVYVRIRNNSPRLFHVSLVNIDVSYAIEVMSDLDPTGIEIGPGEEYVYGADDHGSITGMELYWPDGVPASARRPETVLVLSSAEPHDVTVLQQHGVRGARPAREASTLNALLEHFGAAASRGFRRRSTPYWLHTIEYIVDPAVRQKQA